MEAFQQCILLLQHNIRKISRLFKLQRKAGITQTLLKQIAPKSFSRQAGRYMYIKIKRVFWESTRILILLAQRLKILRQCDLTITSMILLDYLNDGERLDHLVSFETNRTKIFQPVGCEVYVLKLKNCFGEVQESLFYYCSY